MTADMDAVAPMAGWASDSIRPTPVAVGTDGSDIIEFALAWPGADGGLPADHAMDAFSCCGPGIGSTHELVLDRSGGGTAFWVSGQNYDHLAGVTLDGDATFFAMPAGSAPHGLTFDLEGWLWVTFEGLGAIARIDPDGAVVEQVDVAIHAAGAAAPLNPRPHGLAVAPDGSLWFTGRLSNTVGRVAADRSVSHFALPSVGAVPIYLVAGPDGNMWCTELGGNRIARITPEGAVSEFAIPTMSSRPIALAASPDGRHLWFTQEAGGKLGRIDMQGQIAEFPVPLTGPDALLASLAFDASGHLWVQQYRSPPASGDAGDDYLVRFDHTLETAAAGDLSGVGVAFHKAPSRRTVMHRIVKGPGGTMWFTELGLNRIGRVARPDAEAPTA